VRAGRDRQGLVLRRLPEVPRAIHHRRGAHTPDHCRARGTGMGRWGHAGRHDSAHRCTPDVTRGRSLGTAH
jgi:hypothetical protein